MQTSCLHSLWHSQLGRVGDSGSSQVGRSPWCLCPSHTVKHMKHSHQCFHQIWQCPKITFCFRLRDQKRIKTRDQTEGWMMLHMFGRFFRMLWILLSLSPLSRPLLQLLQPIPQNDLWPLHELLTVEVTSQLLNIWACLWLCGHTYHSKHLLLQHCILV